VLISFEGTGKNQLQPCQESMGDASVLSHSLIRNPQPKLTGVLEHCHKEKPAVDSPFFKAFPSVRIPKTMKYVSVHFFIHNSSSCKLYQRIPVNYTSQFWLTF
jgi:hypothetical protein